MVQTPGVEFYTATGTGMGQMSGVFGGSKKKAKQHVAEAALLADQRKNEFEAAEKEYAELTVEIEGLGKVLAEIVNSARKRQVTETTIKGILGPEYATTNPSYSIPIAEIEAEMGEE
jgi:hypothetical protein